MGQAKVPKAVAIVAPLKAEPRATIMALDKYHGDYSRLTDLARMTFECADLSVLLSVLKHLDNDAQFEVLAVKDRLMPFLYAIFIPV